MKLKKCPVCRAGFTGGEVAGESCRRCGSDLSLLQKVYSEATRLQAAARVALACDRDRMALRHAMHAVSLVENEQTRVTLLAALLKNRFYRTAVEMYLDKISEKEKLEYGS